MTRSRGRSRYPSPFKIFFVVGVLFTALLVCVGYWAIRIPLPWAYLLAINLTTLGLYGYDKRRSAIGGLRVPEKVLHTHALVGGTPGAYLGQCLFRHKTIKGSFQRLFWAIFVLQVVLIGIWVYVSRS